MIALLERLASRFRRRVTTRGRYVVAWHSGRPGVYDLHRHRFAPVVAGSDHEGRLVARLTQRRLTSGALDHAALGWVDLYPGALPRP